MIRPSWLLALFTLFLALPAQAAFTDNGDGTVTDMVTGLMWDKCSWGQSNNTTCADTAATTHTWTQALGVAVTANAMNGGTGYKSHNDWRPPNKNELESLVDLTRPSLVIDPTAFPNTVSGLYWSSTTGIAPGNAWNVNFGNGGIGVGGKAGNGYVRLVRSGQLFGSFDVNVYGFTDRTGVALSTEVTSNTITVININSAISIVGGEYAVSSDSGANWSAWSATAPATVSLNDQIKVRQTSSGRHNTLTTATLTIGVWGTSFNVTTVRVLNDTGQDSCYDGANLVACTTANSGDAATNPRQDGRFGRDPAFAAGQYTKTGAGAKGFDYTKICFNGDAEGSGTCTGALAANTTATATGTPATDWACTRDNVTNLIWSLQSGNGNWTTYAKTTLPGTTNTATRCGYNTGWRLPTRRELLSIVHRGAWNQAIDINYFPGTISGDYWSADTFALDPASAWVVNFDVGKSYVLTGTSNYYVRLVRSGQ